LPSGRAARPLRSRGGAVSWLDLRSDVLELFEEAGSPLAAHYFDQVGLRVHRLPAYKTTRSSKSKTRARTVPASCCSRSDPSPVSSSGPFPPKLPKVGGRPSSISPAQPLNTKSPSVLCCKGCNKPFVRHRGLSGRRLFCSPRCNWSWADRQFRDAAMRSPLRSSRSVHLVASLARLRGQA